MKQLIVIIIITIQIIIIIKQYPSDTKNTKNLKSL